MTVNKVEDPFKSDEDVVALVFSLYKIKLQNQDGVPKFQVRNFLFKIYKPLSPVIYLDRI